MVQAKSICLIYCSNFTLYLIIKEKLDYKTLKDLFVELDEQAQELIDFGNSKEKAEGQGMKKVTKAIYDYCKKNKIVIWK